MNYVSDILENLDKYFGEKTQNEKFILIIMVAAAVGAIAYLSFFDTAENSYQRSLRANKILIKKIYDESTYLKSISRGDDKDYKLKQYDAEIANSKEIKKIYNKKVSIINNSLNKLSDLLFNQENWSVFLNSMTNRASANNVIIKKMTNKYIDNNESFGHILEIGLKCEGNFKDIVKFINDLEQNTLVTDIYSSRIYTDLNKSIIMSDINISVWGVNH